MKSRVPVSSPQQALQSPFSALDLPGLPEGPSEGKAFPEKRSAGNLVFRKEKARRSGKTVVVVSGFDPAFPEEEIEELARCLRKQCGCGGTVRDREIELQGDELERFRALVRDLLRPRFGRCGAGGEAR